MPKFKVVMVKASDVMIDADSMSANPDYVSFTKGQRTVAIIPLNQLEYVLQLDNQAS